MIKKSKAFNTFKSLPKKARTVFVMTMVIIVVFVAFLVKSFLVSTEKPAKALEQGRAEVNAGALIEGKGTGGNVSGSQDRVNELKSRQEKKISNAKSNSGSYIPSMDDEEQIAEISVRTAEDARQEAKEDAIASGLIGDSEPEIDIFGKTGSFERLTLTKSQSVPDSPGMQRAGKEHTARVNQKIKYLTSKIKTWDYTESGQAVNQRIAIDSGYSKEKESISTKNPNKKTKAEDDQIRKRGYLKGDVLIATLDNYLNSDNATSYARMTIQQGPLKDAKVLAKPSVNNDVFNIETYWLTHKGRSIPFQAVAITIDDQMKTGIRTDVDYHTFANTSLLILGSFVEGYAERAENTGTSTLVTNTTSLVTEGEVTDKDLIIGGLGKVGERGAQAAIANSNRKPTVILDGKEMGVVGLMMVEDFNPNWLPEIKENQVY